MKRLFIISTLLVFIITRIFWIHSGVPYTHDGENHLARFANYKVAVKEGQLPPRFAPNLLNHYGYPVFNYNYPLANILSLPFSALKIHYELTFKLLVFFSLLIGSFGVIRWLRQYSKNNLPILAGLIGYLSGPPLISTLIFRGSIGEIMAYALWPWLFVSVNAATKKMLPKHVLFFIVIWTAFLLSHNISVFVAACVLAVYGVSRLFAVKNRKRFVIQMGLVLTSAIGLSLWFWLPAIAEMKEVIVSQAANQQAYALHFPTLKQLLYSPLTFGYSYPGPVDTISFWLGFITPLSLFFVGIIGLDLAWRKQLTPKLAVSYLKTHSLGSIVVLLIVSIFLQLAISNPLWQLLPNFRLIQFPWRFGLLTTIFSAPLITWLLARSRSPVITRLLWCAIVLQIGFVLMARPIDYVAKEKDEYDLHGGTTSTQNENLPFTFKYLLMSDWQPAPSVLSGEAFISKVEFWSGSRRSYRIDVVTPSVIVEPTMKFLGWETKVRSVHMFDPAFLPIEYTDSDEIQGRIAYALEPGVYQVTTKFSQNTPARHIGNLSFVVTLTLIISSVIWRNYRLRLP